MKPLEVEKLDGATVVMLRGEVDFSHAGEFGGLLDEIVDGNEKNLVIDLSEAHFIGSAVIGLVVGCAGRLRRRGGELKVCSIPEKLRSIFELLGVGKFTAIFQDRTGALLASPEEVRKHLNIEDRRKHTDRRDKAPLGKNRRKTDRRKK